MVLSDGATLIPTNQQIQSTTPEFLGPILK